MTSGDSNDSFTIDASLGSAGIPIAFDGGAGVNTLNGPSSDTTWTVTGANSGTAAGVAFSNFQNLTGAANNKDTFDFQRGGSVSGVVDGGAGGYDTVSVAGTTVVSNPTDAHSGTLVVDGTTITYTGMEPTDISGAHVLINGADSALDLKKDQMQVSLGSSSAPCGAGTIQVTDEVPVLDTSLAENQCFTISGTSDG